MAGRSPHFAVDPGTGVPPLDKPRLAIVRFEKWSKAEPEQQKVFDAAVEKLRGAGAFLEELELRELDDANWNAINTILTSEGALIYAPLVEKYPDRTSDRLKELVQTGKGHSAHGYLAAKALQEKLRSRFSTDIANFDAVLTLPAFGEAPKGLAYTGDAEYCAPWTFLGVPAATLPAGFGKNRLPLGLQIVGAYRQDYRTLCVAKWVESTLGFDPGDSQHLVTRRTGRAKRNPSPLSKAIDGFRFAQPILRRGLLPRRGLAFDRMNVERAQAAQTQHVHRKRTADAVAVQHADQVVDAVDLDAVEPDHDVAGQQPGPRRRTVRLDLREQRAHPVVDAGDHRVPSRDRRGLAGDADIGAPDIAVADDFGQHELRGVARDRKADALRAADDRGVDADHLGGSMTPAARRNCRD